jgi:hypothetical protein
MLKRRRVITAIAVTASLTVLCGVGSAKAAGAPHAAPPTAGAQSTPAGSPAASAAAQTAAWRDGALQVNTQELVSRSDLVLQSPPSRQEQSMPLGNGRLGAAVWDADGFTAQLNRNDTFPDLESAGQLVVPGLSRLTAAGDYNGRLDYYDAELRQSGGGMSARTYVRADADQLVLEVTGAPANTPQTAELKLWPGRTPVTYAAGGVAAMAETFTDSTTHTTTGQVAAMTADARDVTAQVVNGDAVQLRFLPQADGSFRIVVGVPFYTGGAVGPASTAAVAGADSPAIENGHLAWWHQFWSQADPMEISSADGSGEYMEALRVQQLYTEASTERNTLPGGQAGAVDMLYPWEDSNTSPSTWLHFNLRQDVFANYGAGIAQFNAPYLRLYTSHVPQMATWTQANWPGSEGACVPELLQFDGTPESCQADTATAPPSWDTRILTDGLEVSHDIYETAQYTGDSSYLTQGWPLMQDVAEFYLSVLKPGPGGKLQLEHVNSFETQWDTTDPTPDVAGMQVMFPIFASLATRYGDTALATQLRAAIPKLPALPTTTRDGQQVVAWSATSDPADNTQNTDMEALYPWGVLGASSALMQATFRQRVFPETREWSEDPIWAARLDLPSQMQQLLVQGTENLQKFPNGYTVHGVNDDPASVDAMYSEWGGVVAGALQEALVQTYTGTIRVAAAWPSDWQVSGSVSIPGDTRVSTQVRQGVPEYVGIQAGSSQTLTIANPWPGQAVEVLAGNSTGDPVVGPTSAATIKLGVQKGSSYLLQRVAQPVASMPFAAVTGTPATTAKHLGDVTLGVAASEPVAHGSAVSDVAPDKLTMVQAEAGDPLYIDTSDTIAELPRPLDGSVLIQGAAADAKAATPADYLSFNLARPAPVYVALDARGQGTWWPSWVSQDGFKPTGLTVGTAQYDPPLRVVDGKLLASAGAGNVLTSTGAQWPGDQVIQATVEQVQVGAGIMFRASDPDNGYVWEIGGPLGGSGGLDQLRMSKVVDGKSTLLASVPIAPEPGNTYDMKIVAVGDDIRTYIDSTLADDLHDGTFSAGRAGIALSSLDIGEYSDLHVATTGGKVLFADDFSDGLSGLDVPSTLQDVPLVVFEKDMPAGQVTLGPNSGVAGEGKASYVTFVGGQG